MSVNRRWPRGLSIARIDIIPTGDLNIEPGTYRSLADVDAMLARAFARKPAPDGKPYVQIRYTIVFTDGHRWDDDSYFVVAKDVEDGMRRGGILRHLLWRTARKLYANREYPFLAEKGADMLQRLEAAVEPDDEVHRNIAAGVWNAPTMLPDPYAALAGRRRRFEGRRRVVVAPVEIVDPEGRGDAPTVGYPATTNADVRYTANWISVALAGDVRRVPDHASAIWDTWRATVETIDSLVRLKGAPPDEVYIDNEGLWLRQFPRIAAMLADAIASRDDGRRNGSLSFRPVGGTGDDYPDWFTALRGVAGVYVIRERQDDGTVPIVYVGSARGNLYATISRHLQAWRRSKTFWQGMHGTHDPGLTYARDRVDVAVILTTPDDARTVEYETIALLGPRDNVIGQAAPLADADGHADADVPF